MTTPPRILSIPPGPPFSRVLAETLYRDFGGREALSRVLLLLPTRRACLAMREAFFALEGAEALLLPRIEPLGDVDADLWMTEALYAGQAGEVADKIPPAMPRAARIMKLARLVHRFEMGRKADDLAAATMEHAVLLAEALGDMLDECARERVPVETLRGAVEKKEFARHWEISLAFLEIVLKHWPEIEREEGRVSASMRQDKLLDRLAAHWREHPPTYPVIAAGTTGSIPATAELLSVIARLPEGRVILPGLDTSMEDALWEKIGPTHPQYILKELLCRMRVTHREVAVIGEGNAPRAALMRDVMLPPEATDRWIAGEDEGVRDGFDGMECVACDSQEHEAAVIALRLRAALEEEGKTAMLVTPDRALARRVSGMMTHYGVRIDDSSGLALRELPAMVFLRLTLDCVAADGAPVALLSLLRHPLCAVGRDAAEVRRGSRQLERVLLRGIRPAGGMSGLLDYALEHPDLAASGKALLADVTVALMPLGKVLRHGRGKQYPFDSLLRLHLDSAAALAGEALWAGHAGGKVHTAVAEIMEHAPALGEIDPASYGGVLDNLLGSAMYQPPYGGHPRLKIMSPQEARMQWADTVILGGLNEGGWPASPAADPWMNNMMRQTIGLPPQEISLGQAAHDVALLCCAPEVLLTRSLKQGGAPGIPSRWWLRLRTVVGGERMETSGRQWHAWGKALFSAPLSAPLLPPSVNPPLQARPTELWVTQVKYLMQDPYRFYAAHILDLKPLKPLDAPLAASDFGEVVHSMLERFAQLFPDRLPDDARARLEEIGSAALVKHFHHPQAEAFWLPRLRRIASWMAARESERRAQGVIRVSAEQEAERSLEVAGCLYTVKARIDRMEYYADGGRRVVDYKTGEPPSQKSTLRGVECQLPLTTWIVAREEAVAPKMPEHWKVGGGRVAGRIAPLYGKGDVNDVSGEQLAGIEEGLRGLLTYFAREDARYLACPDPSLAPPHNDYEHLERRGEWLM